MTLEKAHNRGVDMEDVKYIWEKGKLPWNVDTEIFIVLTFYENEKYLMCRREFQ